MPHWRQLHAVIATRRLPGQAALVLVGMALVLLQASATASTESEARLRQLMQQRGPAAQSDTAGVTPGAAPTSAQRMQERAALLAQGEAALAQLDTEQAQQRFDRAALIVHAADTEIALVRTYMQAGEYRRALAFGAHTAGAHLDVIGGAALYAWLLHMGGQPVIAQRLLAEAAARQPAQPLLASVVQQLQSGAPLANAHTPELLALPTRLAPYADQTMPHLAKTAQILGSAALLPDGLHALVAAELVPRTGKLWLRNGLGQTTEAKRTHLATAAGLAVLALKSPLPLAEGLGFHTGNTFPGSVGYSVAYSRSTDPAPAWPVLRTGFLGPVSANGEQQLGIAVPAGSRGGPVFDTHGRLSGMALPGATEAVFVPLSRIQPALAASPRPGLQNLAALLGKPGTQPTPPAKVANDVVYERALKTTLQIIGSP